MQIYDGIEAYTEYPWFRSKGWNWDGERRWWEVSFEPHGLNGLGGLVGVALWRWNKSSQVVIREPKSMSLEETDAFIKGVLGAEGE